MHFNEALKKYKQQKKSGKKRYPTLEIEAIDKLDFVCQQLNITRSEFIGATAEIIGSQIMQPVVKTVENSGAVEQLLDRCKKLKDNK